MKKKNSNTPSAGFPAVYGCYLLAGLWLILGLVFSIWPGFSSDPTCFLTGFLLVLSGVITLLSGGFKLVRREEYPWTLELSAIFLAAGIWVFSQPDSFFSMVPVLFGVMFWVHGLADGLKSIKLYRQSHPYWWSALILGAVLPVLGTVLLLVDFSSMTSAIRFLGISLIFNGLADFWISFCLSAAGKYSLRPSSPQKDGGRKARDTEDSED